MASGSFPRPFLSNKMISIIFKRGQISRTLVLNISFNQNRIELEFFPIITSEIDEISVATSLRHQKIHMKQEKCNTTTIPALKFSTIRLFLYNRQFYTHTSLITILVHFPSTPPDPHISNTILHTTGTAHSGKKNIINLQIINITKKKLRHYISCINNQNISMTKKHDDRLRSG